MITTEQSVALDALRDGGPVREVAGRLGCLHAEAESLVLGLVMRGLLERHPRRRRYTLTAAGKAAWIGSIK